MVDVNSLVATVFFGLSALVVEDVAGEVEVIRVVARTRGGPMPCPACGTLTSKVHGFHGRTLMDVPVDGRRVVVSVRLRRLVCPVLGCPRQTFREQVPGLVERYQRRTTRLDGQLGSVVKELAGRAGSRLSRALACAVSRSTALRKLMRLPVAPLRVPRVIGIDDFALKRRHRYATIVIDAETGERIDVLPDRSADTVAKWLREHPGAAYVCRDGSGSYGEAIRRSLPQAVQVSDRWHLWHNLCDKSLASVRAHAACWATVNPARPAGVREQSTRQRWRQVHDLLGKGVGLLECAPRYYGTPTISADGILTVQASGTVPHKAICCPSLLYTYTFQWVANKLVLIAETHVPLPGTVQGLWKSSEGYRASGLRPAAMPLS